MNSTLPILYSFRRCPYAMRARLALRYARIRVELREVVLSNKPTDLLNLSPKGTVPVMLLDGDVLEESLDIMLWALGVNDPLGWLDGADEALKLIKVKELFYSVLKRVILQTLLCSIARAALTGRPMVIESAI